MKSNRYQSDGLTKQFLKPKSAIEAVPNNNNNHNHNTARRTDSYSTKHFNYLRRLTGFFSGNRQTFHIINTVESVNK